MIILLLLILWNFKMDTLKMKKIINITKQVSHLIFLNVSSIIIIIIIITIDNRRFLVCQSNTHFFRHCGTIAFVFLLDKQLLLIL